MTLGRLAALVLACSRSVAILVPAAPLTLQHHQPYLYLISRELVRVSKLLCYGPAQPDNFPGPSGVEETW